MGELTLDPLLADPAFDFERRIGALEQRPQVVAPVAVIATPYLLTPSADWYIPHTNAAYGGGGWSGIMPRISHQGVYCRFAWRTGAGTTGLVALHAASDTRTTSDVVLPAASSGVITFRWLHGLPLWAASYNLDINCKRTGGANLVEIQTPLFYLTEPAGCTASGL